MTQANHTIVIDAGNTQIKVGLFQDFDLQEVHVFSNEELEALKHFLHPYQKNKAIIASVRSDRNTRWLHQLLPQAIRFSTAMDLPIKNSYHTIETLGVDRIANAIAAYYASKKASLVIDMGTCIKYDFVDEDGCYQGGAISPGIAMRFKAMHTFTGKLPLIEERISPTLIGKSTVEAMTSGALKGAQFEIEGYINEYLMNFPELTIFLTGGDHSYFDIDFKNGIFADENLTLKGLLITLLHAQP